MARPAAVSTEHTEFIHLDVNCECSDINIIHCVIDLHTHVRNPMEFPYRSFLHIFSLFTFASSVFEFTLCLHIFSNFTWSSWNACAHRTLPIFWSSSLNCITMAKRWQAVASNRYTAQKRDIILYAHRLIELCGIRRWVCCAAVKTFGTCVTCCLTQKETMK